MIFDIPLIVNSGVIVFQPWKLLGWGKQIVFLVIEPAVADIESSNIGLFLIYDDQFPVMGPQGRQFSTGMSQHFDIFMFFKDIFGVLGTIAQKRCLIVQNYIDNNPSRCGLLQ